MSEAKTDGPMQSQPVNQPAAIRWDDAGIKSSYSNVCNVSSTREEVMLNFGLNQAWERPQQEVQVQLTNRIILSPYAAKRVALLLSAVIQQYESRFGKLDIGVGQAAPAQSADQAPPASEMKPHVVK